MMTDAEVIEHAIAHYEREYPYTALRVVRSECEVRRDGGTVRVRLADRDELIAIYVVSPSGRVKPWVAR